MKKKIISFLLALGLTVLVPFEAYSDEIIMTERQITELEKEDDVDADIKKDTVLLSEDEREKIEIAGETDLLKLAENCAFDTWSADKYVILTRDISITDSEFEGIPYFAGVFDGNGHKITGFNISDTKNNTGFIAYLEEGAIIRNLKLSGKIIPPGGAKNTGGIVGQNNGIIINCSFEGLIDGCDSVGAIAGVNEIRGIIADCTAKGYISGKHYTGGIVGYNRGNITRCQNEAMINTTIRDETVSVEDISIDDYVRLFTPTDDSDKSKTVISDITDTGGIAGYSMGVIRFSGNEGKVGYEHVGYNTGGIVGRQSGYVLSCTNNAEILGRKDVGGIVGQAEPYITVDLSHDVGYQLSESIKKLQSSINKMLDDAGEESDTISGRLDIMNTFAAQAIDDIDYLSSGTIDYVNGMSNTANEAIDRVDYIINEASKEGGLTEHVESTADNTKSAASEIRQTVEDLDMEKYMSDTDRAEYENNKQKIEDATSEYEGYVDEVSQKAYDAYHNFYIMKREGLSSAEEADETDLYYRYYDEGDSQYKYTFASDTDTSGDHPDGTLSQKNDFVDKYKDAAGVKGDWMHQGADASSSDDDISFPNTDNGTDPKLEENAAGKAATDSAEYAKAYADDKYYSQHSSNYNTDITDAAARIADLIKKYLPEMSDDARADANEAVGYLESATRSLGEAGGDIKNLISGLKDKGSLSFPSLDPSFKERTGSLNDSVKMISDNFSLLNSEVNGASDILLEDFRAVSDEFSNIMLLYTDAVDGALERDYTNSIEDESLSVCETSVDATVDSCVNNGLIKGDIDVAGIAGTEAIEYDFDPEGDVTGISDAKLNSTFLTKCVLRNNNNFGTVTSEKSYVGGICGNQELGIILRCGNYESITSSSGDYVGGVVGSSLSNVQSCYSKCALSGKDHVGGIAGEGLHIKDSLSMVNIEKSDNLSGAIAGSIMSDGVVRNNYYVSDTLKGIDRVSYKMKAEPRTYEELVLNEGFTAETGIEIPDEFRDMKVTFVLDDEEKDDILPLGKVRVKYMNTLEEENFPSVPSKEGYYVDWSRKKDEVITSDTVVTATYERYVTTLASETLLKDKQSQLLVDGDFRKDDVLDASEDITKVDYDEGVIESWNIIIPDDGNEVHRLRYMVDNTKVNEKVDKIGLYIEEDGKYTELEKIETMGRYSVYEVRGNDIKLIVKIKNLRKIKGLIALLALLAVVIISATITLLSIFIRRRKKKLAGLVEKVKTATHNAAKSIGNDNHMFLREDEPIDELDSLDEERIGSDDGSENDNNEEKDT